MHLSLEQMRLWIINMSHHYTKYHGSALTVTNIYIGSKCDHYLAVQRQRDQPFYLTSIGGLLVGKYSIEA